MLTSDKILSIGKISFRDIPPGMPPSKAPWLFKAKKMMEGWKKYKVLLIIVINSEGGEVFM